MSIIKTFASPKKMLINYKYHKWKLFLILMHSQLSVHFPEITSERETKQASDGCWVYEVR